MFACSCIVRNISCSTSCPYWKCFGFLTQKVRCCQCSCDRTCCRKETFLKHRKQVYLEERVWPYNVPSLLNIAKWSTCKSRGWIQPASLRKEEEEEVPFDPWKILCFLPDRVYFPHARNVSKRISSQSVNSWKQRKIQQWFPLTEVVLEGRARLCGLPCSSTVQNTPLKCCFQRTIRVKGLQWKGRTDENHPSVSGNLLLVPTHQILSAG